MSEEERIIEHNKMIAEIISKCNYMIENRYYMNDIAIKQKAQEIIDVVHFYVKEPEWEDIKYDTRRI